MPEAGFPCQSKGPEEARDGFMDLDVDVDVELWPLDQVPNFIPNPMSPFVVSDHQPCSPLWAFPDGNDDKHSEYSHRFRSSCNSNSVTERPVENDESTKILSPFLALETLEDPDRYCVIKERMTQALRSFKDLTEKNILAQVWAPVRNGSRYMLTTSGQPFILVPHSNGLHQYRTVSLTYIFSLDGDNDGVLGLPGRVFRHKLPEWTPNVQYYSCREYPRRNHAQHFNVRGTLALPVFEPLGQSCIGVLELVMTSEMINYAPDVDKVCKALEAVNLKSSEILDHPSPQICNEGRQKALTEILEILTVVCETHNLPLAQTWVPCRHRSVLAHGGGLRKSCSSIDGSCMGQVCMSTTEAAFYVVDAHMWGFREACVEHHLQQGQGGAGRAFSSLSLCFCKNVTHFCKTEYPLAHYAQMFGLTSCFAVCLQSSHTGNDIYVLEFFLPPRITDFYEQKTLLGSILATMKQHFHSLLVAAGIELEHNGPVEIVDATNDRPYSSIERISITKSIMSPTHPDALSGLPEIGPLDAPEGPLMVCFDGINGGDTLCENASLSLDNISSSEIKSTRKTSERKRGKAEKTISLEVLQQYFTGSLKDAAKSLGVCPTTMKRICRQHGIPRWPSRKINKVNRSLSKLKRVIESVQGAEGAFSLNSLSTSPLPISKPSSLCESNPPASRSHHGGLNEVVACKTTEFNIHAGLEDQLQAAEIQIHSQEKLAHNKNTVHSECKDINRSKTGSSSSEDSALPTSHGLCQDSPQNESSPTNSPFIASLHQQCTVAGEFPALTLQPSDRLIQSAALAAVPNAVSEELQEPFGGMLVKDAGSSKDLRNLCPSVADGPLDDQVPEISGINPPYSELAPKKFTDAFVDVLTHLTARKERKSVTIKASYREDIIRFRISSTSSIVELKEEVARRLKLEVGTFDIKYLDDDHEWVLIACDADLQECMDVLRSSGTNIVRLLVHDLVSNLGSSCESSGG